MMKKIDIDGDYYSWLCNLIDVEQIGRSYWRLTRQLYEKTFKWIVPNDDNRVFEGKQLREKYCEEFGIDFVEEDFNEEVSMLELLIALAYRCESMIADMVNQGPDGFEMIDWFWRLLANVKIDTSDDTAYSDINEEQEIDTILNNIIDRTYKRSGNGGLFPLKYYIKDQRKVELWYQMSAYLVENYYSTGTF